MILAGEIVSAGRLGALQPTTYYAVCTTDLVAGNTDQDVVGATVTFDTVFDNAVYVAEAVFDMDGVTSGSTSVCIGMLNVDGVTDSAQALSQVGSASASSRVTAAQRWHGTLASAGSHTIKLMGTTPSGGVKINAVHTTLTVTTYEAV
nr:hypothetical protein [Micromonospora sp. DSM 115978]